VKKDDLALIVSETPAEAAGVFTSNLVQAAPVLLSKAHLRSSRGKISAIVINAGNANCATRTGESVSLETCKAAAAGLGVPVNHVLPASTGVIGVELPVSKITKALPRAVKGLSAARFQDVANAIMTTDLVPKTAYAEVATGTSSVRIAGMTKGSGMIHPNMATTLAFVMTDAAISPKVLQPMLSAATEVSFNRLSVDGDQSTNDTLVLLANGASGIKIEGKTLEVFAAALTLLLQDLAAQIAKDGEGAKKRITIHVSGAASDADAALIARAIANSPLVKTAVAGSDPNWGRILSAAGFSGAKFDPRKVDIGLQRVLVCSAGLAAPFSEKALKKKLDEAECFIEFFIRGKGVGKSRFWSCDLTKGYIDINASYRT
jgi:glutamate N-acetyltransferase/amino-acid N-acetyltransferase